MPRLPWTTDSSSHFALNEIRAEGRHMCFTLVMLHTKCTHQSLFLYQVLTDGQDAYLVSKKQLESALKH